MINKLYYIFSLFLFFSTALFSQSEYNVRLYQLNYILPDSSICNFLPFEREIIKAEILANYGFIFSDTLIQKHFDKQIWYQRKTSDFPELNSIDSINYLVVSNINNCYNHTVYENIWNLIPDTSKTFRIYYTKVRERSDYKRISKRGFQSIDFGYCGALEFYQPEFIDDIPPDNFEFYLNPVNFNIVNYKNFITDNKISGDLFRNYYHAQNIFLMKSEQVGIEPTLDLGQIHNQYVFDEFKRLTLQYNFNCGSKKFKMATLISYSINKIIKEVYLVETTDKFLIQFTTEKYHFEIGFSKEKE